VVPALMFVLATFSNDLASQAVAKGGHGGGHKGGGHKGSGHHSVSHHKGGGHHSGGHKGGHASNHGKGHPGHGHDHGHGSFGFGVGVDGGVDGDFAPDSDSTPGSDVPSDTAAPADASVVDSITLVNPQETHKTVGYTLGSAQYSLDAAQTQVYDGGPRAIVFDRGGSFGQAQYTLQPGTYRFTATDRGWDLRSVTEQVSAN